MIDLQERKKQLTEEVARCTADIEQLQMALQRAMQARERLLGGLQLLNELLQPGPAVAATLPAGPPTADAGTIDNAAK